MASGGAGAQQTPEQVVARAQLEPASGIVVGQRVDLYLEVLTETGLARSPRLPEIEIEGAIVLESGTFGVPISDRIDGRHFSGTRLGYAVYPQRSGICTVPPIELAVVPAGASDREHRADIAAQHFNVALPAELAAVASFVTTPRFEIEWRFDRALEELRVGDSLTRSVSMRAEDAPGMLLPPLPGGKVEGLAVYPDTPQISEDRHRGRLTGRRLESVTYVMEREGEFRLPPVDFDWWNPDDGRLHTETLPAVELTVAANPDLDAARLDTLGGGGGIPGLARLSPLQLALAAASLTVLAVGVPVLLRLAPRLSTRWRARRLERKQSEAAFFRRFRRSARRGDAPAAMRQLFSWLDRFDPGPGAATLSRFVRRADDGELAEQAATLEAHLFTPPRADRAGEHWSGRGLSRRFAAARRRLRRPQVDEGKRSHLPPLNAE
jgi:hypothetical protein